ncbi:MAG: glutamate synthase-related protein, partial [Chloroflexota bacterium]|nr:glutamate synthase-related protein [Chloroflexota bacterium]
AQVTNPPIDPERERAVMDLRVELGRRPALLGGIPAGPRTVRLDRPIVADLDGLIRSVGPRRVRTLDATWTAADGPAGFARGLAAVANEALLAVQNGSVELLAISDRAMSLDRPPLPSVLAVGAVHSALSAAGLRGRADLIADACDILDVHGLAMAVAAGATAVHPRLAIELAAELAGSRGAETMSGSEAVGHLLDAFEAGLRKTLARMGISAVASYVGGALFETLELAPEVVERCFPSAAAWPGRIGFEALAERGLRRLEAARELAATGDGARLADPGLARFRADGELHLYAPVIVKAIQAVADGSSGDLRTLAGRDAAVVRDGLRIRRPRGIRMVPIDEVEPAQAIVRRFVASAMSVGALSPEAHQAVTIGMQRAGGAANTGEGGEDPAWYRPSIDGERHDARIKQVASARFGVTAAYLARADQLEIKIAQGSKPGEGGQLPAKKATAEIAALRRAQPGQSLISPPPHHDIYSIEDLAQLIADLRAINPRARIGVKLVASRGVGTIAAGVVKAGADYVHLAGHSGGTGASPLSSIKHAGAPWELGLAEVHQTLLRNGLRDRVVLRTDGGLQVGRDLLVAALLGAEEFGFGTATLVALGCDMARQCHLDTCPTGIATQRPDLRAKFTGTPEQVERFALAVAEDLRRELAAIGARSVGEIVGESRRYLTA